MAMTNAQRAAGIVVRFTRQGGCCKILDRRVRVESKILREKRMNIRQKEKDDKRKGAHPHCITMSVKKYTLCASWSRLEVSVAG